MSESRMAPRLLPLVLALLLAAAPAGGDSFREEFDQPGAEPLAPTRFSVGFFIANSTVERGPIAPGQGAPATGGVLPVDEGGDFELRFFAPMSPAGSGYARTPEIGSATSSSTATSPSAASPPALSPRTCWSGSAAPPSQRSTPTESGSGTTVRLPAD